MATQKGVLQALWGEVRPAVEARRPDLCPSLVRLVNRGDAARAIAQWTEALGQPALKEEEVLRRLARRHGADPSLFEGPGPARERLWEEGCRRGAPGLVNCRLLLEDPAPDRIWLHRSGAWVLYRFSGGRFVGTRLERALAMIGSGEASPEDLLLSVRMGGRSLPNPKLPRLA